MARTCSEAKLTKFPVVWVSSFLVIPFITSLYSVGVILKMVEQKVILPWLLALFIRRIVDLAQVYCRAQAVRISNALSAHARRFCDCH